MIIPVHALRTICTQRSNVNFDVSNDKRRSRLNKYKVGVGVMWKYQKKAESKTPVSPTI